MRRRDLLVRSSAALVLSLVRIAQAQEKPVRIAILLPGSADDPRGQGQLEAFRQALTKLGWKDGGNARIEEYWGKGDIDRIKAYATELAQKKPDLILSFSSAVLVPLQQATRTVPIVFVGVTDPLGTGVVQSLAHPGGNVTGFINFELDMGAKWLELLRQLDPQVRRVLIVARMDNPGGAGHVRGAEAAAPALGASMTISDLSSAANFEQQVRDFSRRPGGGMIFTPAAQASLSLATIIDVAARYRLPTIYPHRIYADQGGFAAYGIDAVAMLTGAADYVDRILRGQKPGDLPIQALSKYELIINLKTAKSLGITIPSQLLARADRVIE